MLVPIKWLKDYVNLNIDAKSFGDAMTMSGSKVEAVEEMGKEIDKVLVGRIAKIERHPDADKLVITQIDIGSELIQIVTGANNIKEGDYIPVAVSGASLPGGVRIKKGKLRGIESNGMLCSAEELGIPLENLPAELLEGIYILDKEYKLGIDIKEVLGLDDAVIEFEITNNRPDCLSMIGIAREAAATLGETLVFPEIDVKENNEDISSYVNIEVRNGELCPRYVARVVKNVKIQPSPGWMQERLQKAGVRPINNIVDITNYVMLELGQPMHAFDLDKLPGRKIIVRNAFEGEKITTLDEVERNISESMLVIADQDRAIAIAGIMGSSNSEIDEKTTTMVFESANFEQVNIRLSSKKLGLRTEASGRFEKGIDTELADVALDRACHLVQMLGAGEIVGGKTDIYSKPKQSRHIKLDTDKARRFIGADISTDKMKEYLEALEFSVDSNFNITVPTFRNDVEIEADVIEEITRIYGYENIPSKLMDTTFTQGGKSYKQKLIDKAKSILTAQGLFEVFTYSFVSPGVFNKINLKAESPLRNAIKLINPLGEEQSIMRTTIIPNIMDVIARNYNRKIEEGQFFELSKVYLTDSLPLTDLAEEREVLTIGLYGKMDFFELKGIVENLMDEFNISNYRVLSSNFDSFHPGRTAELIINNKRIGWLGEAHPDMLDNYGVPVRAFVAELNFDEIVSQSNPEIKYKTLPKYPSVSRDIAVVVAEEITAGQIEEIIRNKGGKTVEEVKLFDIYRGSQIDKGYKSMAYSIVYRSDEKTMAEEDVAKVHNKILNSLANQVGAALRQ